MARIVTSHPVTEITHEAKRQFDEGNRKIVRAAIAALVLLLIISCTSIVWGLVSSSNEIASLKSSVQTLQQRQTQFHQDTTASDKALATAGRKDACLANSLESILLQWRTIQEDQANHLPIPSIVVPAIEC